jgi:hypothetical protein
MSAWPTLTVWRAALAGTDTPAYEDGAAFLRQLGMDQSAEIARVLDIAMNPNSLFVTFRDKKRAVNADVRLLTFPPAVQNLRMLVHLHDVHLPAWCTACGIKHSTSWSVAMRLVGDFVFGQLCTDLIPAVIMAI